MSTNAQLPITSRSVDLKARVIVGASHAYACITTPTTSLDVQLLGAMSASASLERSAAELREKARSYLARAELMETAALLLDRQPYDRLREGVSLQSAAAHPA